MKCNIDASFSHIWNCTGISVCVCDDGAFVPAKTMSLSTLCPISIWGEPLGLFYGLEWFSDMHMDNVERHADG